MDSVCCVEAPGSSALNPTLILSTSNGSEPSQFHMARQLSKLMSAALWTRDSRISLDHGSLTACIFFCRLPEYYMKLNYWLLDIMRCHFSVLSSVSWSFKTQYGEFFSSTLAGLCLVYFALLLVVSGERIEHRLEPTESVSFCLGTEVESSLWNVQTVTVSTCHRHELLNRMRVQC
jgi:hypothetical protein